MLLVMWTYGMLPVLKGSLWWHQTGLSSREVFFFFFASELIAAHRKCDSILFWRNELVFLFSLTLRAPSFQPWVLGTNLGPLRIFQSMGKQEPVCCAHLI